ncbi:DUF2357 domain-containing protein [Belliella aquatica]|uniref:DUF2357 domain-containing protein n=1 Tax=Belliella aquatica TaxID=1323734 RepID=A0ABQ1LNQ4_9BACT|nr:DUF2357 domain-containing protein [Belliella aquatica]MCH7404249.1 DUF2357 domain-containing protein [Belliella aquatica]GGC26535.1 hypothetical protein GCM10010993_01970 [Belliella aquatica]
MAAVSNILIDLSDVEKGLVLEILEKQAGTLFDEDQKSIENNEARFQLVEGSFYEYDLNNSKYSLASGNVRIIQPSQKRPYTGIIAPNIFVGTLYLSLKKEGVEDPIKKIPLEVQSKKTGYRDDYRDMLEFITEKCTDLLLQINSPVYQNFEPNFEKDISENVLYQRFIFLKSIIGTSEFHEAVHRIVSFPNTKWEEETELKDVRNVRRFSRSAVVELVKGKNRIKIPSSHPLVTYGLNSVPSKILSSRKVDSVDTPENRFIKYALETFLKFSVEINAKAKKLNRQSQLSKESEQLVSELENHLYHTIFNEISAPHLLKLNSPVLQRKEGYREVLRVWLMFDLAAKLIWKGGEDVYEGGKKDIATLYEYWLFFKLLEILQHLFQVEPNELQQLISIKDEGLNVNLKQGKFTALIGIFNSGNRKFHVQFNYNRSFQGKNEYPKSGSWTTTLRPDYTLSVWPSGISETQAELEEVIVHIHFDAKYKVDNIFQITDQEEGLDEEKTANRKGIYKNADLLKMHAYKDAIRRTGGAYVLYPGTVPIERKGFHEIIPGLGAFPVRPSKKDDGTKELEVFIKKVIDHFINRASQREKIALKSYEVYKKIPKGEDRIDESLPEPYGINRTLIPDDTFVLVGYYKSREHLEWINKEKKYNFRTGTGNGSLSLDFQTVSSKYLLLHTKGDQESSMLWKIVSKGPKVYSKADLLKLKYPLPNSEFYLVVDLVQVTDEEFKGKNWNFRSLKNYKRGNASAFPFTTTLAELIKN